MNNQENKFEIHYSQEDLVTYYKNKFILEWCKQNKPEIFEKAKLYAQQYVEEHEK